MRFWHASVLPSLCLIQKTIQCQYINTTYCFLIDPALAFKSCQNLAPRDLHSRSRNANTQTDPGRWSANVGQQIWLLNWIKSLKPGDGIQLKSRSPHSTNSFNGQRLRRKIRTENKSDWAYLLILRKFPHIRVRGGECPPITLSGEVLNAMYQCWNYWLSPLTSGQLSITYK